MIFSRKIGILHGNNLLVARVLDRPGSSVFRPVVPMGAAGHHMPAPLTLADATRFSTQQQSKTPRSRAPGATRLRPRKRSIADDRPPFRSVPIPLFSSRSIWPARFGEPRRTRHSERRSRRRRPARHRPFASRLGDVGPAGAGRELSRCRGDNHRIRGTRHGWSLL